MTWYIDETKDYPIIEEIEKQTDRGAGIMAAALLDGYLTKAIGTRLFIRGSYNDEVMKKLCDDGRPLGSFVPRIHAGFLLGLYLHEAHSDLETVAVIRNIFAHRPRVLDFEHRDIRKLCKKLILIRRVAHSQMLAGATSGSPLPSLEDVSVFVDGKPMRWRYIRTVQIIVGLLIKQTIQRPPLPPLPSPF
jgi:hypothetical protein